MPIEFLMCLSKTGSQIPGKVGFPAQVGALRDQGNVVCLVLTQAVEESIRGGSKIGVCASLLIHDHEV